MAITTTTISLNAGFARTSIIGQLESAFTWLGFNGARVTGIVTGISAYGYGGDINASATYEDVRHISSTGIGTGASFYITRDAGGLIDAVYVNRSGIGYTNGERVTLSSEDIGGSANGAISIGVTVFVAGGASPTGFGTTSGFFDKDVSSGASYPWGIARHTIQSNKRYGDTYRGFQVTNGDASTAFTIQMMSGSSFHPWSGTNTSNRGNYYPKRFAGTSNLDIGGGVSLVGLTSISTASSYSLSVTSFDVSSSNGSSYGLDLNVYRSGLDPRFAVFSYKQPALSSTHLTDNSFGTFFFHNFTTSIWDLNELFLGGLTRIIPTTGNTISPAITFQSHLIGNQSFGGGYYYGSYRCAESGYLKPINSSASYGNYVETVYSSQTYSQSLNTNQSRIYYRNNSLDFAPVGANSNFNAVIKGIPLSTTMIPCPYYIPDDFVLIDFNYTTPSANIQQGDTITISGSEVYTVITGSYNQTTRTRGILFCARKV